MGYNELSLPVDIPWKRLGVSGDMLDENYGDLRFPSKWDTSIAVFYHEPAEVDPAYCHRRITYLKIVCTITNYQLRGKDVSVLGDLRRSFAQSGKFEQFELNARRSYPCHGALLQVGVFPDSDSDVELHDFPYISSMQPRKRELYEVANQSGEIASQSANKLNVNKGQTSTQTQEDYDLDTGGGSGGHSGVFGLWSEQHSGEQKQVGTIARRQTQDQNVATSDASRDRRESYSFSTSINQLHTLLQSYHLGTNRAMFFLQPVPHMQDEKFSFVGGLRRLEGIQEFFLIVSRPANVEGLCIEIALETAHAQLRRAYEARLIPLTDLYNPGNLQKTEAALGAEVQSTAYDHWRRVRDVWNHSHLHERWAVNTPGWEPSSERDVLMSYVPAYVPSIGAQDVALIFEEYEASSGYFFVSGRKFCACWKPTKNDEHEEATPGDPAADDCEVSSPANLSWCDPDPGSIVFGDKASGGAFTAYTAHKAQYLNTLSASLNTALASSLTSPKRQNYGEGSFFSTEPMLDELAELAWEYREHLDPERPAASFAAIHDHENSDLPDAVEALTFAQVSSMSSDMLARRLGIEETAAAQLRLAVLLEALTERGKQFRDPPEDHVIESPSDRLRRFAASARGDARPEAGNDTDTAS